YSFVFISHRPTSEFYTLSLHDALPICEIAHIGEFLHAVAMVELEESQLAHGAIRTPALRQIVHKPLAVRAYRAHAVRARSRLVRSEEHTSELQSLRHLVCRLLLEKKKK